MEAKLRIIELLKNGEEEAQFSKTLAEIRRDAPIDFSLEKISWKDSFAIEEIKPILNELGFKRLLSRIQENNGARPKKMEQPQKEKLQADFQTQIVKDKKPETEI